MIYFWYNNSFIWTTSVDNNIILFMSNMKLFRCLLSNLISSHICLKRINLNGDAVNCLAENISRTETDISKSKVWYLELTSEVTFLVFRKFCNMSWSCRILERVHSYNTLARSTLAALLPSQSAWTIHWDDNLSKRLLNIAVNL